MKNKTKQVALDDTDLAILALLQEDASISNAQLSERLALSLTPCWRRRKRLTSQASPCRSTVVFCPAAHAACEFFNTYIDYKACA